MFINKLKKCALVLSVFTCLFFNFNIALASDSDIKDLGSKTITDTNKIWTVSFKKIVDVSSLSNNVKVNDVMSGTVYTPTISEGNDAYSIKVNPPSGGYGVGHEYQLILNKDIKSQEGENLPKTVLLTFYVVEENDVSANVVVSPFLSMLKKVTLNSEDFPQGTKFKIEGSSKIYDIGNTAVFIANTSTVDVYFYSSDGSTKIGTGTLDVSSTNASLNVKITN